MPIVCTRMSLVCHLYVTRMYSYVIRMSLVCHFYVTRMYSYVIRMSVVCIGMSFVCHLYVLVCHSYITRVHSYVIRMSLDCGFTMNPPNIQGFSSFVIDRKFVKLKEISDEKHISNVQFFTFSTYIHRRHMKIEAF